MFNLIKRWFDSGKWSDSHVLAAVSKGWISEEEANSIINS